MTAAICTAHGAQWLWIVLLIVSALVAGWAAGGIVRGR